MTTIANGSRSNPDNVPVQTRMTPFQIAALKAIASMEGINSAALMRNLVDECIQRALTEGSEENRQLLVGLLKHRGFVPDLERVIGSAIEQAQETEKKEAAARQESFKRSISAAVTKTKPTKGEK